MTALLAELAKLRKTHGPTQKLVAERMSASQENVSRLERAEDMKVTTLIRYVEAIGGDLSIVAAIAGESVSLHDEKTIV